VIQGPAYRSYLLGVLLVIYAFTWADRSALGLLLQDIKVDLALSDTQLGFLSGIAFALFYSIMGIPIARYADRGNRVAVIATTMLVCSAMVTLCGMAGSFAQLLLIRVGVGIGEAGCIPPAHSLIADYFARAERARAAARYMLGGALSVVIGYFVTGWLNELYGWRATFMLLGLPGLVLAPLAWFTLKEPRRAKRAESSTMIAASSVLAPGFREVWATLWAKRSFRHLLLSYAVMAFFAQGIAKWQPAFFMRSHGLETGELGTWFAVIYGAATALGIYVGGEWASRRAAHDERLQLKVIAVVKCSLGVIGFFVYFSPNPYLAFGLMALVAVVGATAFGPLLATIQTLVPERMRATSIALIYLFANLIGMGLGPLATGFLSDMFRPWAGDESLRYALLALCPGYLWVAWHTWEASRTVTRDLEDCDTP
jgi:MFS family permease